MGVRIDKWLWAARFFKTRGLATEMVNGCHVQQNGKRIKASRQVNIGDELHIRRGNELFIVTVTALAEKRGSAAIARTLYRESEESIAAREPQAALHKLNAPPAPTRRPDKKARRHIIRFIKRED